MMKKPGISVIICCYNSADRLERTLSYLAKQKLSTYQTEELIIVDNNSNDNTGTIAKQLWEKLGTPFPMILVNEDNPGLSNARQKGIQTSQYDYLIFCDDDNWLAEDYMETVRAEFDKDNDLAIIGGKGIAVFEKAQPFWFDRYYQSYAVGAQASSEGYVNNVYGAGMAIKKQVLTESFEKFGPLQLSGRKGKKLSAGEDSEICLRIRILGYKILYTQRLLFKHFLSENRLNWPYINRLHLGFAHTFVPLKTYEMALNNEPVGNFFWLKQCLFYLGRAIKYSFIAIKKILGKHEFDTDIIRIKSWYAIAADYLRYNFTFKERYKQIKGLN